MAQEEQKKPEVQPERIPLHFQLGEKLIDGATLKPVSFQAFSDIVTEANGMTEPKAFETRLRRLRLSKQLNYHVNGSIVPVSPIEVLQIPLKDVHKLIDVVETQEGVKGKVTRDGDGIAQAITYELGTPIPQAGGKPPITELEFHAVTYGDVEDVLSAPSQILQTVELINKVAKPLGTSLTVLPSWGVNAITVADGLGIMNEILPRFLGTEKA